MYTDPAQMPSLGADPQAVNNPAPAMSNPAGSYVDEYTPPATTPAAMPTSSNSNYNPPFNSSAADTNHDANHAATQSAQAALDELEKLLAEIKAKNADLAQKSPAGAPGVNGTPSMGAAPVGGMPISGSTPAPAWELPATPPMPAAQPAMVQESKTQSESLEDQNIFFLLGVTDGTDEQKEAFLDELQQTIWEDFVEHDVKLLLTTEEFAQFEREKASAGTDNLQIQEKLMAYLEPKIPDLEDILLEKALELKADMVRERIAGLKEYHAGKTDVLSKIEEAEQHLNQGKWHQAATILNGLPK